MMLGPSSQQGCRKALAYYVALVFVFSLALGRGAAALNLSSSGGWQPTPRHEVTHLPGYVRNDLPSRQYTGYLNVNATIGKHLFYWMVESEGSPEQDPVVLWLTGGPGCSSMDALIYEHGPFSFEWADSRDSAGGVELRPNPHSWSKAATMIYVDSPAGTGFSFTGQDAGLATDDDQTTSDLVVFLQRFFEEFPHLADAELFVAGESYAGVYVPLLTQKLVAHNAKARPEDKFNLQGYLTGNGVADDVFDGNGQPEFAYNMGLIDPPTFAHLKELCKNNFWNATPGSDCRSELDDAYQRFYWLNPYDILEDCFSSKVQAGAATGQREVTRSEAGAPAASSRRLLSSAKQQAKGVALPISQSKSGPSSSTPMQALLSRPAQASRMQWPLGGVLGGQGAQVHSWHGLVGHVVPCADRRIALEWLNRADVREALRAPPVDVLEWQPCSDTLHYHTGPISMLPVHKHLISHGVRALIYSGDHDFVVPFTGTRAWVYSLGLKPSEPYQPWTMDGQVAGFVAKFREGLTFATVKGAGHMVPQSSPARALHLFRKFLEDQL